MKRRQMHAFTLIELLVVVAIISLLSAILFPVFARARENTRRASCMSNLKQIGVGMMMYVQDYDETYPPKPYVKDGANQLWDVLVQPYVKSFDVFYCPSSPAPGSYVNGNYGANREIIPIIDDGVYTTSVRMPAIQSTANLYMILDFGAYNAHRSRAIATSGAWEYLPGMEQTPGSVCGKSVVARPANKKDCESGRHFGGVNVAFADGHVKWLKSSELVHQAREASAGRTNSWQPQY